MRQSVSDSYGEQPDTTFAESKRLQDAATEELPEGTSTNARGESAYAPYPVIYLDEGDGAIVTDVDGNEYIDYLCGFSSIIRGHTPADEIEAATEQINKGALFGAANELEYETAKLVNDLVPASDLTKFTCSGTEGTMNAIRLARSFTGKDKIIKFEGFYHGHHDYVMVSHHPATGDTGSRQSPNKIPSGTGIPEQTLDSVEVLPWNDTELLAQKLEREGDEIAAVITEGLMSNGGALRPTDGFLQDIRDLTREHNSLMILDEVVTGFRMGLDGAQGYFDIEPDLAVFGKALANGYPTAALTGREEVMRHLNEEPSGAPFYGTYTGNPLALAGAKVNLEALSEIGDAGYDEFLARGQRLVDGLREIATDAGHDIFIPDFAGYFFMHFTDGETDPTQWTEWRDVDQHVQQDKIKQFSRAMIGEGVYFLPKFGRINMTHAHTDEHVTETLEAAKTAIQAVE